MSTRAPASDTGHGDPDAGRLRQRLGRVARALGRHPLVPVAVKAAIAASLAWLAVYPLRGAADDYAYYAPLGAVIVVSSRLGQSLRSSVESVLSISLGAGLALGVRMVPVPDVLGVGLVVGVGTAIGAWKRLGSMASWVPISALFILIVGGSDPATYVLSYLGLTALGAVVGVLVNLIAPPLPLVATRNLLDSLRDVLAEQLDGLAEGLERDPLPTADEWTDGQTKVNGQVQHAQELVSQIVDSTRINWRVRRLWNVAQEERRQGQALRQLSFLTEEIVTLLSHQEHADLSQVALGPELRPGAAEAFHCAAAVLRSVEDSVAAEEELSTCRRSIDDFADAIRDMRRQTDEELFAAGSLVVVLRRVLTSVTPERDSG